MTTYAKTSVYLGNKKTKTKKLHQFILPLSEGMEVDHRNVNGLDNRKENLRPTTRAQNSINLKKTQRKTSSQYKGVSWNKYYEKWKACIKKDDILYHIGYFYDEVDAAKAYDKKAKELHGEFARLNFP